MAKGGLGKGLGALFNEDTIKEIRKESPGSDNIVMLRIVDVEPNKEQPRKVFDEEKLSALASSIKEHGVISPIIVREYKDGFYQIIAGERRWRASKMAGLKQIPAIVRTYDEMTVMEVSLIENLQRENLNPIEEALGYKSLMDEFNLTQEKIAQRVAKSRSAVANSLRLLALPKGVLDMVADGQLSSGHARAILSLSDESLQAELAEKIVLDGLNVRQAEALAKKMSSYKSETSTPPSYRPNTTHYIEIEKALEHNLGTKVKISDNGKKGRIEIEYYGADDLDRILKVLNM